jgi:phospholipid transport system substrate-binding protein
MMSIRFPGAGALRRFLLSVLALVIGALLAAIAPAAVAQVAPDKKIEQLSEEILARIKADDQIRGGDIDRISRFVDEMVMPHVNFERMTALTVGRGWRDATPEQRAELVAQFRMLLLRTYSGALSEVRDQKIRMKPLRADPADKDVIVRSEVIGQGTEPIQLDYRLERSGDDWKIFDINVLGVWLVETYRNQFSQIVGQSGVPGLIDTLREKNAQPPARS